MRVVKEETRHTCPTSRFSLLPRSWFPAGVFRLPEAVRFEPADAMGESRKGFRWARAAEAGTMGVAVVERAGGGESGDEDSGEWLWAWPWMSGCCSVSGVVTSRRVLAGGGAGR